MVLLQIQSLHREPSCSSNVSSTGVLSGYKAMTRSRVAFEPIKHDPRVNERLQKHSTKSMSPESPNKCSNCEGKILAYKKNKPFQYSLFKEY